MLLARCPGWSIVAPHLVAFLLCTTWRTGSCLREASVVHQRSLLFGEGAREGIYHNQMLLGVGETNTEMHIEPIGRQPGSVVPERYYSAPHNINQHLYRYVINNPNICIEREEVLLLMMVRTAVSHVDRRMAIRDTWAATFNLPAVTLPLVFLLGAARDQAEQKEINLENQIYRDIIQEDFVDSDMNQTIKTVMGYKWARTYCPHADFVMLTNDDVTIDIFKLVPYLQSVQYKSTSQFTMCYLYPCCMLAEYPSIKSLAPLGYDIYSGNAFPAHCASNLYIASSSVINRLYLMSIDTPMFVPEGPWIGVLAEKLGLTFTSTFRSYVGLEPDTNLYRYFNISEYLATPVMFGLTGKSYPRQEADTMRKLWSIILANHRDKPPLDVKHYMGHKRDDNESHIYQVALAALLIDLCVMAIIGYIIFCRKKPKILPFHSTTHYHYQR